MRKLILAASIILLATPALASDGTDPVGLLRDRAVVLCDYELDPDLARDMLARRTVSIEQIARDVCARAARLRVPKPLQGKFVR